AANKGKIKERVTINVRNCGYRLSEGEDQESSRTSPAGEGSSGQGDHPHDGGRYPPPRSVRRLVLQEGLYHDHRRDRRRRLQGQALPRPRARAQAAQKGRE